ncbi:MurR/RpiR family transcriptional regulator [Paenibacillus sp. SYP-B3998]|uniref:MurR/RpiR family transcriptional regulator n=1 Tax=Paenibacillus sp. SYP-B3998 TaxID=2678564 RepID=A0A6G4A2H0_9BACL|nr:MurR/RpiR family transcriptional regulator [Paenibacillus sp. SYP-B3998]NEW07847.1 MurR/RpiR family transcriptional regulator [Paenibacillus sp. SYP-B3998]
MDGGLVRLREVYDKLNPSEKKVADYILQHPTELVDLSVAQLADNSGASQAAIIRLCKSMGIKGYQDLKIKVVGDLRQEESEGYQEIRPHDSITTIIQHVSNNNIQSIRDTVKILDPAQVERAIDALNQSNRIYIYGVGASNLIAMDAQQKFLRMGRTCFSFADPHVQLTSAVGLKPGDIVVGISYSGETKEVIRALELAKERGSMTISITKYGSSTLSRLSDIPLCTSSTENEIRSGAMASRITQLNVIDILYLGVASRDYEHSVKHLEESRKAIRNL